MQINWGLDKKHVHYFELPVDQKNWHVGTEKIMLATVLCKYNTQKHFGTSEKLGWGNLHICVLPLLFHINICKKGRGRIKT